MRHHDRDREYKRAISNIVGVIALTLVLCLIFVTVMEQKAKLAETQRGLDELAKAVADRNELRLMDWARGSERDFWENTFVLAKNSDEVQFLSKGPDGKLGTKDDLRSKAFPRKKYSHATERLMQSYAKRMQSPKVESVSWASQAWERVKNWRHQ